MLPYHMRNNKRDIDLYINSVYSGFVELNVIEEYYAEYWLLALEKSVDVPWDHVILYAIFEYDPPSQVFVSANFMTLVIPYGMYTDLIPRISERARFFFIRGKREW